MHSSFRFMAGAGALILTSAAYSAITAKPSPEVAVCRQGEESTNFVRTEISGDNQEYVIAHHSIKQPDPRKSEKAIWDADWEATMEMIEHAQGKPPRAPGERRRGVSGMLYDVETLISCYADGMAHVRLRALTRKNLRIQWTKG